MSKEILAVVAAVSAEKGVSREVIFNALEAALVSATYKSYSENIKARVSINREEGNYTTFRCWEVVDDAEVTFKDEDKAPLISDPISAVADPETNTVHVFNPDNEILLSATVGEDQEHYVGQIIEKPIESIEFGRIAAQIAKQVIFQHVRMAEREQVIETYKSRIGELIMGNVKQLESGNVILDLGGNNVEVQISRDELIPREIIRPGDRMRAYLYAINSEPRGPQLIASRTANQMMVELFKLEVPEIREGWIEIMGCARDPGVRAKLCVQGKIKRLDPVGACVGMRGSRVQAISNQLFGERVDIILWDESPAQYVINAMSPADVVSIIVDEEKHSMDVIVEEDKLPQAIGRNGQNVRLASQLCGWKLDVMTVEQAAGKNETESTKYLKLFTDQLDVDEEIAQILIQEGFASIEEVAYVSEAELQQIDEFDEETATELKSRAQDALLQREIAMEEDVLNQNPAEDLLFLEEINADIAYALAQKGIANRKALAELATDDLLELIDMDRDQADNLIMNARAMWFDDKPTIDESNEETATKLVSRVQNALPRGEITMKEAVLNQKPAEDLLSLEAINADIAYTLAQQGIANREALAELATDDLLELIDMDRDQADNLIMNARAMWFDDALSPENVEINDK